MTANVDMIKKVFKAISPRVIAAILLLWGCLIVITLLKDFHTEYPNLPSSLDKNTLHKVRDYIHSANTNQLIHGLKKDPTTDLVIVIAVHKQKRHLEELIHSLSLATGINNTLLIFSHESYNPELCQLIHSIPFAKVMQIFYPFSIQTHPDDFPGPSRQDYAGSTWRNAKGVSRKHHWWWTANFVFNRVRFLNHYKRFVLFLENDHFVTEDFVHCLYLMSDYIPASCPTCWFGALGLGVEYGDIPVLAYEGVVIREDLRSVGLAFNRTIWDEISKFGEFFCKYDDLRWAPSLEHLTTRIAVDYPISTLTMLSPRVLSTSDCNSYCRSKRRFPQFPPFLEAKELQEPIPYPEEKKGGGWGDARDQALCMGM